jgi:hypothetical protein
MSTSGSGHLFVCSMLVTLNQHKNTKSVLIRHRPGSAPSGARDGDGRSHLAGVVRGVAAAGVVVEAVPAELLVLIRPVTLTAHPFRPCCVIATVVTWNGGW